MRTAFAILLLAGSVQAEVQTVEEGGFDIRLDETLQSTGEALFEAFTGEIDQWWNGAHTYSGSAGHLTLDRDCFCERWAGNLVRHMGVVQFQPGRLLRLTGGLGPLQALPLTGVMDIRFEAADGAEGNTRVTLTYAVRGPGLDGWAGPVHAVISEQFDRFVARAGGPSAGD